MNEATSPAYAAPHWAATERSATGQSSPRTGRNGRPILTIRGGGESIVGERESVNRRGSFTSLNGKNFEAVE